MSQRDWFWLETRKLIKNDKKKCFLLFFFLTIVQVLNYLIFITSAPNQRRACRTWRISCRDDFHTCPAHCGKCLSRKWIGGGISQSFFFFDTFKKNVLTEWNSTFFYIVIARAWSITSGNLWMVFSIVAVFNFSGSEAVGFAVRLSWIVSLELPCL